MMLAFVQSLQIGVMLTLSMDGQFYSDLDTCALPTKSTKISKFLLKLAYFTKKNPHVEMVINRYP